MEPATRGELATDGGTDWESAIFRQQRRRGPPRHRGRGAPLASHLRRLRHLPLAPGGRHRTIQTVRRGRGGTPTIVDRRDLRTVSSTGHGNAAAGNASTNLPAPRAMGEPPPPAAKRGRRGGYGSRSRSGSPRSAASRGVFSTFAAVGAGCAIAVLRLPRWLASGAATATGTRCGEDRRRHGGGERGDVARWGQHEHRRRDHQQRRHLGHVGHLGGGGVQPGGSSSTIWTGGWRRGSSRARWRWACRTISPRSSRGGTSTPRPSCLPIRRAPSSRSTTSGISEDEGGELLRDAEEKRARISTSRPSVGRWY